MWAALFSAKAQQTATFEDIILPPDSIYNGSDGSGGFYSGEIWFPNEFNAEYNVWSGFAVSNMKDTITSGYGNQYSAITGMGAENSENYGVIYCSGELTLEFEEPVKIEGFYITNSVYAYLDMLNGSGFTKKFGGMNGNDPDYFKLLLSGTDADGQKTEVVEFFLADFRSDSSQEDYIVRKWLWLDLTSLGIVKEIHFSMESSDTGDWGMNTPAYFCIDSFTLGSLTSAPVFPKVQYNGFKVFPNPVDNIFQVEVPEGTGSVEIFDQVGRRLYYQQVTSQKIIDISSLGSKPSGTYYVRAITPDYIYTEKVIKY